MLLYQRSIPSLLEVRNCHTISMAVSMISAKMLAFGVGAVEEDFLDRQNLSGRLVELQDLLADYSLDLIHSKSSFVRFSISTALASVSESQLSITLRVMSCYIHSLPCAGMQTVTSAQSEHDHCNAPGKHRQILAYY